MITLGPSVYARVMALVQRGDEVRTHLLQVTARMLIDQPLFGVGSGAFAHVFRFYSDQPAMQFGSWSAHNLFAQFLSEQGAVGLVAFLTVVATTVGAVVYRRRHLGAERTTVLFLLVSLGAWLLYGTHQYTFLMRSMQVYFWITLGLLVSLAPGIIAVPRVSRAFAMTVLGGLLVLGGVRIFGALQRSLPTDYVWGLNPQPGTLQWSHRAVFMNLVTRGSMLRLEVACPVPQVAARPQTVSVLVDGVPMTRVTLETTDWKTIDIPVDKPLGSVVVVQLRTAYTFHQSAIGIGTDTRRVGVLLKPARWL